MSEEIRIYRTVQNKRDFGAFFRKLSLTNWLILFNIICFLLFYSLIAIYGEDKIFGLIALQAKGFFSGNFWTLITSIFLHGSLEHLLFNMISLFFIGNFVEKLIGRKRFFWFYIISGILAGLFYAVLSYYFGNSTIGAKLFMSPDTFAVGASGAIFALLGLLAMLTPNNRVYLIAGPLIAIVIQASLLQIFPNSGVVSGLDFLVTVYIFVSIFSMISFNPTLRKIAIPVEMPFWLLPIIAIVPLIAIGLFIELPIGNTAHLGGLICGLCYAVYLKKKYKRKTEMIKKYFSR